MEVKVVFILLLLSVHTDTIALDHGLSLSESMTNEAFLASQPLETSKILLQASDISSPLLSELDTPDTVPKHRIHSYALIPGERILHGTRPIIEQTVESGNGLTVRDDGTEHMRMNKCGEWVWDLDSSHCPRASPAAAPTVLPFIEIEEPDDVELERVPEVPESESPYVPPSATSSTFVSVTLSRTPSPTPSLSRGASASPTISTSPSLGSSASSTPSRSFSSSTSLSRTASRSWSPSRTPTASEVVYPNLDDPGSPSTSRSFSASPTASPSRSSSRSLSKTPSSSPTPSQLAADCCNYDNQPEKHEIYEDGYGYGYDTGYDAGIKLAYNRIQNGEVDPKKFVKFDGEGRPKAIGESLQPWEKPTPMDVHTKDSDEDGDEDGDGDSGDDITKGW